MDFVPEAIILLNELFLTPLVRLALGCMRRCKLLHLHMEVVAGYLRLRDERPVLFDVILKILLIDNFEAFGNKLVRHIFKIQLTLPQGYLELRTLPLVEERIRNE